MDNDFGLDEVDVKTIIEVLSSVANINEIIIFGSRAKGTFRSGSDVDLALKGQGLNTETIIYISSILNEETTMPYWFDVINYHTISNVDLREYIDRIGRSIYKKQAVVA